MAREALTRERILLAGAKLADAEGLGVVTMRRVAASLGVEAMSLYHHVPSKAALLDGLVDVVVAQIVDATEGDPARSGDWRGEMRHRCLSARRVMTTHPWGPGLIGTRATIPQSLYLYYDGVLATLVQGDLDHHLAHRGLHALGTMVLGFVQEPFAAATIGGRAEVAEESLVEMAEAVPHLTAMMAAEVHAAGDSTLGWCDSDAEFSFTLGLVLDGLERAREERALATARD